MRIWIDFENTPHVLILKPIVEELQNQGHSLFLTARDCSQTLELADLFGLDIIRISHHHGKNRIHKIVGHTGRIARLIKLVKNQHISVAISHGSRSQIMAAGMLRIPTFVMWDYEHASLSIINRFITRLAVPDVLTKEDFEDRFDLSRLIFYPGIKENIYVGSLLNPDVTLNEIVPDPESVIITIRPPATDAHYYKEESSRLFFESLNYFKGFAAAKMIIISRTASQQRQILDYLKEDSVMNKVIFPSSAINGLSLIWNSDIVIGGGGTMNREAAVLGVPVYSIFQGRLGGVDKHLMDRGRLKMIQSVADIHQIKVRKRDKPSTPPLKRNYELIDFLVKHALEIGK
ncbi:DUF354 domain-containing protein [candidate division KSB1 bacterium]|nr:DUF354 domain-containing protein [candidate division KSB1 bacterium]